METSSLSLQRALAIATASLSAILLLTGCSTPQPEDEPYFDKLASNISALTSVGFTPEGEPGVGCGGSTPFCAHPVFTIGYISSANTTPEAACEAFVSTTRAIATPTSYASAGSTAGPIPVFAGDIIVKDFCIQGLDTAMPLVDGTEFYQGTLLFDTGVSDQIAKHFSIGREPNGTYRISIDFSRNLEALWWETREAQPAHLTLEQVLQNNEDTKQIIAAQEFTNSLIGKSERAALAAIQEAGYITFVFQRDSVETPATGSNPKRIMLNIQDGVVLDAMAG